MFEHRFAWPTWIQRLRPPSMCHLCGAWPSEPFCDACVQQFGQPVTRCATCASPFSCAQPSLGALPPHSAMPSFESVCASCQQDPSALDKCLATVTYGHPWSQCIAKFKFHGEVGLARPLAQLMRNAPWVEPALEKADWVLPIPLSASRLCERGFNQSYELVKHLAPRKADVQSLQRLEHAIHQVGATREARLAQARNTFWIEPSRVAALQGSSVVLLDDVMTTGATMLEAARTLRKAGVAHITGLVFARAELATT